MNIKKTFALAAAVLVAGITSSQALSLTQTILYQGTDGLMSGNGGTPVLNSPSSSSYLVDAFDLTGDPGYFSGINFTSATIEFTFINPGDRPYYVFLGSATTGWDPFSATLGDGLVGTDWNSLGTIYPYASNPSPLAWSYTSSGADLLTSLNADGTLDFRINKFGANHSLTLVSAKITASYEPQSVPEGGSTMALLASVLLGLAFVGHRMRKVA